MADPRPIGVFDSGLGGLTVVKALRSILPGESIIYFGDTARLPYGNKSQKLIETYSQQIADFLMGKNAKLIVVACNTASSLAMDTLNGSMSVPVIGVIEPGVATALKTTKNGHIGIIGTIATVESGVYEQALKKAEDSLVVISQPCPLFVPLVEEGWTEGKVPDMAAATYLKGLNAEDVDTIILGCTHYPILKDVIQSNATPGTELVDSAEAVASAVKKILSDGELKSSNQMGTLECFVTDVPVRFESMAKRFLGSPIEHVSTVSLH